MVHQRIRRTCGECRLCCFTHGVRTETRRVTNENEWCRHCSQSAGCTIYDARPKECEDFSCDWLGGTGGAWEQPHLIGVVADRISIPDLGLVLRLAGKPSEALNSSYAITKALNYVNAYCPVFLCHRRMPQEACLPKKFHLTEFARMLLMYWSMKIISPSDLEQRL